MTGLGVSTNGEFGQGASESLTAYHWDEYGAISELGELHPPDGSTKYFELPKLTGVVFAR